MCCFKSTEKINRKGDDKDTNQYSNICLPHEFCTHLILKGYLSCYSS